MEQPEASDDPVADWRESVAGASPPPALTTVGPDFAVVHEGTSVRRYHDLEPDSIHEIEGFAFRTLPVPGPLLSTFTAVNDVHFGEEVCGLVSGSDVGPVFRVRPGEDPYPETMNAGAISEMAERNPSAVLVKGDLTSNGTLEEYERFRSFYEPVFAERLFVIRGNHESFYGSEFASDPVQQIDLAGVTLVMVDTSINGSPAGTVRAEQIDEVDEIAASASKPVLLFGHHQLGDRESTERADHTFGIDVDASDQLVELAARRSAIRGYFAGHTHRNRVRFFDASGDVPWVEVACVKDYPGGWAEYRVHDDAILQIFHRISTPEALSWSERTRQMHAGLYEDYAFGSLSDRCFVIPVR